MATILSTKIILRNDTAASWLKHNPVLLPAEFGVENDTGLFKIGDGKTPYNELRYAGGNTQPGALIGADGFTINQADDGTISLNKWGKEYHKWIEEGGYYVPVKVDENNHWVTGLVPKVAVNASGALELAWFQPSVSLEELTSMVQNLAHNIGQKTDEESAETVFGALNKLEAEQKKLTQIMLPLAGGTMTGDLILSDGSKAASENYVATSLQELVSSPVIGEKISTAIEENNLAIKAKYLPRKYEVVTKPLGSLVDYREKEIRVFCPKNTEWSQQNVGPTGDKNLHYMAFRAYAPENAVAFREDDAEVIADTTLYTFDNNKFAGVDEYGRKYSVAWLALARYDGTKWNYFGATSTKEKYIGWYYTVEWYDADGNIISSDQIRINLSNEDCHTGIEPYYMAKVVKQISVNGTLLETIGNKVEINAKAIVKESEEIGVRDDGILYVKRLNASKLFTDDTAEIVLNGGNAN